MCKVLNSIKKTCVSYKKCTECGKVLPYTKEYFHSNGKGGLRADCKKCNKYRKIIHAHSKNKTKPLGESERTLITIPSEMKKVLNIKKNVEGLSLSDYINSLLFQNIEPEYFEILQNEKDIKTQKELWKLSYSIEINEEEYEGMVELTKSFPKVHFYNDDYYAYKPHLMLIKGFFDDHKLNLLIEKIEDRYNTEIYKELDVFSINEPCEYDTGLFLIEGKAIDTGFICLKLYAKNTFGELTEENQDNLKCCYKAYKNYPIQVQVILKPNGKEFKYMDTIEIK